MGIIGGVIGGIIGMVIAKVVSPREFMLLIAAFFVIGFMYIPV